MADWERLLDELHARDMRLIMDLVVNHTSAEHEWFEKSRRREGEYEDYYIWRDGERGEPPNNWESIFGGPAWSWDDAREGWYLHLFDENQPDLNWRNPAVRAEVKELMRWWLEKGIDGFRMDAINFLSKREGLPDGDPDRPLVGAEHYRHGPNLQAYLEEVSDDVLSEYDVVTVGEMGGTSVDEAADFLSGGSLDMVFQFTHLTVDEGPGGPWDREGWGEWELTEFKRLVTRCQHELAAESWDAVFLGNHDLPRVVSRFGSDEYREESAKLVATFLLTLRGTPFLYQGDEVGMTNAEFDSLDELDDPMTTGIVEELLATGEIASYEEVREFVNYRSRDHARTPMQWSSEPNAGFTDGEPWFAVNENYPEVNVERAVADEASVWHHYRRLIDLRRDEETLVYGDYDLLAPDDEQLYAYTRSLEGETVLVVLNWSERTARFETDLGTDGADVLVGNYANAPTTPVGREFRPYEAVVYRLRGSTATDPTVRTNRTTEHTESNHDT
jgi:oligo-1,6-glucosidase